MSFLRKIDGDKLKLINGESLLTIAQEGQATVMGSKSAGRSGGAIFR